MCGIFGIITQANCRLETNTINDLLNKLFILSESRGKESSGIHLHNPLLFKGFTLKTDIPATELSSRAEYKSLIAPNLETHPITILAHSRLVTNGAASNGMNNQPVNYEHISLIHNGIIVNDKMLWQKHPNLQSKSEVDSEVIAALIQHQLQLGLTPIEATQIVFSMLKGSASIGYVNHASNDIVLATNTGDLYYLNYPELGLCIFASERFILNQAISSFNMLTQEAKPIWINPKSGIYIQGNNLQTLQVFNLPKTHEQPKFEISAKYKNENEIPYQHEIKIINAQKYHHINISTANEGLLVYDENKVKNLKRCKQCILPHTFPYISFNADGICNFCENYQPKYKNLNKEASKKAFFDSIEHYKRQNGTDVIVPFSGGRDSSFGLHLISQEYGFKPVTFTYDWGMVTDLARRNIARMCGQLGVQNILVSANIRQKRENIRKNIKAWLKKPQLGIIPLFMAGDKHFFKIVNDVKQQTNIDLNLWCANPLENTDFKSGFCHVSPDFHKSRVDYLSFMRKAKLASYYAKSFVKNPSYINSSLFDTFTAFLSYYFEPRKDFYFIFDHFPWEEHEVNDVLINTYDWEISNDSPSTWRIGDGTAAFYNYLYTTANGFSEFDTFRSNQIREGMITREEAMQSIVEENRPRYESMKWYFDAVGLDFNETIKRINSSIKAGQIS